MQKRLTAYELTLAATLLAAWLALDAATKAMNAVIDRQGEGDDEEEDDAYKARIAPQSADLDEAWEVYVAVLEKVNEHASRVHDREGAHPVWSAIYTETTIPEQGDHYDDVVERVSMPEEDVYGTHLAPAVDAEVKALAAAAAPVPNAATDAEVKSAEPRKYTPITPSSPTTTVLMTANGFWSRGRSLSEAVANMHKAGLKRGVLALVWDVEWLGEEAREEARAFDRADASKPTAERIMSQARVNDDGSPLAYVDDMGSLMYAPGARSVKRGAYNHATGKVTEHK